MTSDDRLGRRIEHALLAESVEELYEHAPCGYLSTLPDGTIVKVNQTFVDWTGATRDMLLAGTKFQALLSIGSRVYYETHYAPLLQMQGFVNELALEVTRQNGRILPVLLNAPEMRRTRHASVQPRHAVRFDRPSPLRARTAAGEAESRADREGQGRSHRNVEP